MTCLIAYLVLVIVWLLSVTNSLQTNLGGAKKRSLFLSKAVFWVGTPLLFTYAYIGDWVFPAAVSLNVGLLLLVEGDVGGRAYYSGATKN